MPGTRFEPRYQSVPDILADLNTWRDKRAANTIAFDASIQPWGRTVPWPLITGVVTVLLLALCGYVFRDELFGPSPFTRSAHAGPVMSLAIVPFRNATGDPSLDWLGTSLAEMLTTDVGHSASLRTVSADRLHQVLKDLHIESDSALDAQNIKHWRSSVMRRRLFGDSMFALAARSGSRPRCRT